MDAPRRSSRTPGRPCKGTATAAAAVTPSSGKGGDARTLRRPGDDLGAIPDQAHAHGGMDVTPRARSGKKNGTNDVIKHALRSRHDAALTADVDDARQPSCSSTTSYDTALSGDAGSDSDCTGTRRSEAESGGRAHGARRGRAHVTVTSRAAAGQALTVNARDADRGHGGGSADELRPARPTAGRSAKQRVSGGAAATPAGTPPLRQRPPGATGGGGTTPGSARAAGSGMGTPLQRPVRSCTQALQQPSSSMGLATPLSRLALGAKPAGAAAASTPRRGRPPAAAPGAQRRAAATAPTPLRCIERGGHIVRRGHDVYLLQDGYDGTHEDEDEACEVCGSSTVRGGNALLECDACLRGFHLRCLHPPLKSVPDGEWLCPDCSAQRVPPPPARLNTRWQKLLYGREQLALAHVISCQRGRAPDGSEEDQLRVRYYLLPQETVVGRQQHHHPRELFLGTKIFEEPAAAFAGRAYVHPRRRFGAAAEEDEGNDVYMCEYEYDESWQRFRRRNYDGGAAANGAGGAPSPLTPRALRGGFTNDDSDAGSDSDREFALDGPGSDADSDGDNEACDASYRPELFGGLRGGWLGGKRKRHGQLPSEVLAAAAAAQRFASLGASHTSGQGDQQPQDAFARLHAALSLAAVPASLPCRDEERGRLTAFVRHALHEDGGVLYICGVPGTGKTALVMETLAGLQGEAAAAGGQLVALNCLQLPTPQHVFSRLWERLTGQRLGPARAREALSQLFAGSGGGGHRRRSTVIVVLDEVDMLATRDQAVLYQLFDWPHAPGSRLAVIGISNTHDLDQRVLPRIASRLDQAKLAFAPYGVAQLTTIVRGRLHASGVGGAVEETAVQLACRKVASETGDVRRALEMLRRAVEIARHNHTLDVEIQDGVAAGAMAAGPVIWAEGAAPLVRRADVTQAQREMGSALHHQLLRSRSTWDKLLLVAVIVEARATGRSAVVMQNVVERASNSVCSLVDLSPAPPFGVLQQCLVKLAGVRLLLSDGVHVRAHVALNVDKEDVALAIREDERLSRLHQLL